MAIPAFLAALALIGGQDATATLDARWVRSCALDRTVVVAYERATTENGIEVNLPEPREAVVLLDRPFRPLPAGTPIEVRVQATEPASLASATWFQGSLAPPELRSRLTRSGPISLTNRSSTNPEVVNPGEIVEGMVFPVLGGGRWSDTFLQSRGGGRRRHLGQDIMVPKLTPLVAAFDGEVFFSETPAPGRHVTLTLIGDNGWVAEYMHLNNDAPGTNDGNGGRFFAFPPHLRPGDRVEAGQIVAWSGNSGNAESTSPHLHFELWRDGVCHNPAESLRQAQIVDEAGTLWPSGMRKPVGDELRFDGRIERLEGGGTVLMLGVATETSARTSRVESKPRLAAIRIGSAPLRNRMLPDLDAAPEQLQGGNLATVIARRNKEGRLEAVEIWVAAPPAQMAPRAAY